jgi:ABC-2 type transport system permease protein
VRVVPDEEEAVARLEAGLSDGYIYNDKYVVEGSNPGVSNLVRKVYAEYAMQEKLAALPPQAAGAAEELRAPLPVEAYYGGDDYEQFDFLAPSMMGLIICFLIFILSGISFLRERISGTLERLMVSSLRRGQLVVGYFLGFGVFAVLQTVVIQAFMIYVLQVHTYANFFLILLINLTIAGTSLALGTLLSAFARNDFQLFQFIPLVIIPQALFCGLIDMRETPAVFQYLSQLFPLTYGAEALRDVMLRGMGLGDVLPALLIMLGFMLFFIALNVRALRKYRNI